MGFEVSSVGIPEISPYMKSEQSRVAGKNLLRHAKNDYAAVVYIATLLRRPLSFCRVGNRCCDRWITDFTIQRISGEKGGDSIFRNRNNSTLVLYHSIYGEATQKVFSKSEHYDGFQNFRGFSRVVNFPKFKIPDKNIICLIKTHYF